MNNLQTRTTLRNGGTVEESTVLRWERILVPVDFSAASVDAVKYAARIARRDGSSLCLLHVVDRISGCEDENLFLADTEMGTQAEKRLAKLARLLVAADIPVRILVHHGRPVPEILEVAADLDCDVILLGTHKASWWDRLFTRSVAQQVAERTRCHVLMVGGCHSQSDTTVYWEALADKSATDE